jgi:Tol biopolymer transport system component
MDTELCEPRQIIFSPKEERSLAFAPDGKSILFVSDMEGESNIWRATRADSHGYLRLC